MDLVPLVGIGPIKFGMTPRQVKALLGKKLTWEPWMGGNRNVDLYYPGLVVIFDHFGANGPFPWGRVEELQAHPSLGAAWSGRLLAQLTRVEVIDILTTMDAAPKLFRNGAVESEKLGIVFNFSEEGSLSLVRLYGPAEAAKPRRWWQFWRSHAGGA